MARDFATGNLTILDHNISGTATFGFGGVGTVHDQQSGGGPIGYVSEVTQHGITWTFELPTLVGQYLNGDYWAKKPFTVASQTPPWQTRSVTFTNSTDGIVYTEDILGNGAEVDPEVAVSIPVGPPTSGAGQGFDMISTHTARKAYHQEPWDPARRQSFPYTPPAAGIQSIVSTISSSGVLPAGGGTPHLDVAAILTCVEVEPSAGSFRPPYCGGGSKPTWNTSQVNYGLLPALADPPVTPWPMGSMMTMVNLRHVSKSTPLGSISPMQSIDDTYPGHSMDLSHMAQLLCLASQDQAEIANRIIQHGIDLYEIHLQNGAGFLAIGGFGLNNKFPIVLAGVLLNDAGMMSPQQYIPAFPAIHKFQEDGYAFYGTPIATVHPNHPTPNWQVEAPWWGQDCAATSRAAEPFYNHNCRTQSPAGNPIPTQTSEIVFPGTIGLTTDDRYPEDSPTWMDLSRSPPLEIRGATYRQCCQQGYAGQALAARLIPGVVAAWGWPAFFDYCDRYYLETADAEGTGPTAGFYGSPFTQSMWKTYRGF